MTNPERLLWAELRNGRLDGYHFRRQHPIGEFIVDFCCVQARLIIEVDGDSHEDTATYDRGRTEWLANQKDYQVMRVTNDDVLWDPVRVRRLILHRLRAGPSKKFLRRAHKRT